MRFTIRLSLGVALGAVALAGCPQGPRVRPDLGLAASCSTGRLWRLPDEMPLNVRSPEKDSYAALVTKARLNSIALAAAVACRQAGGTFPSSYQALLEFAKGIPLTLAACALDEDLLVDGWGGAIYYQGAAGVLVLRSAGADRRFTSDDDISMPPLDSPEGISYEIDRNCRSGPSVRRPDRTSTSR